VKTTKQGHEQEQKAPAVSLPTSSWHTWCHCGQDAGHQQGRNSSMVKHGCLLCLRSTTQPDPPNLRQPNPPGTLNCPAAPSRHSPYQAWPGDAPLKRAQLHCCPSPTSTFWCCRQPGCSEQQRKTQGVGECEQGCQGLIKGIGMQTQGCWMDQGHDSEMGHNGTSPQQQGGVDAS
jgi:hypothetical protein